MLIIRPIEEKSLQEAFALSCGVPYRIGDLAYAAYVDGNFTALSQFRVCDTHGILDDLVLLPGSDDTEALFLLGRQTLNWIDLLGIHLCRARTDAADPRLLSLIGFQPDRSGDLAADLTHMFDGSCGGHCDLAEKLKEL